MGSALQFRNGPLSLSVQRHRSTERSGDTVQDRVGLACATCVNGMLTERCRIFTGNAVEDAVEEAVSGVASDAVKVVGRLSVQDVSKLPSDVYKLLGHRNA